MEDPDYDFSRFFYPGVKKGKAFLLPIRFVGSTDLDNRCWFTSAIPKGGIHGDL